MLYVVTSDARLIEFRANFEAFLMNGWMDEWVNQSKGLAEITWFSLNELPWSCDNCLSGHEFNFEIDFHSISRA